MKIILILAGLAVLASGRRIRVRPVGPETLQEAPQQIEYYAEQDDDQGPVLISRQDTYGRANGQPRLQPKLKAVENKAPPVQTIRNYNKLNDDGSFTFGYEAADGSFKEETRGTDCVVRGKYGYVDPDGNKREFSYVSGNPCDPNAPNEEEEESVEADSGEENIPKNIPRRPNVPRPTQRPAARLPARPSTSFFQQEYNQESEEENVPVRTTAQPIPQPRPTFRNYPIPTFAQLQDEIQPQVLRPTPRPKPVVLASQPRQSVSITPRPTTPQPPATTYRPQLIQVSSPAPTTLSKPQRPQSHSTTARPLSFDDELKNFQLEHNAVTSPRPSGGVKSTSPIYTSELVFDPASGQYNTVLYQQLPQTNGDFNLRGRLQPYVAPQQSYYQPRPYSAPRPPQSNPYAAQQQLFQQQQSALLQQSQQLFAQQQQKKLQQKPQAPQRFPASLLQQEPQRFSPQQEPQRYSPLQEPQRFSPSPKSFGPAPPPPHPQQFYYVAPSGDRTNFASGQIDAFLRGHSISI